MKGSDNQTFVRDINKDEIRDGFLVTSQRKKLWNEQIRIILEMERICRQHDLRWFAYGGTLLGAVRHKGFIPWDDDADIAMFRPDYDRFTKIASQELGSSFFLDCWYNHRIEGEPPLKNNEKLPMLSKQLVRSIHETGRWWPILADHHKVRLNDTMAIQWSQRKNVHQGIWVDIFPLDSIPSVDDEEHQRNFEIGIELFYAASHPEIVRAALDNGNKFTVQSDSLRKILSLPFKERALLYEAHMNNFYFDSKRIGSILNLSRNKVALWEHAQWLEIIHIPFEEITIPVPKDYDSVLKNYYGNWRKMVILRSHMRDYSRDVSYKDFFKMIK